jgi:YVTN family beta-propeller protein
MRSGAAVLLGIVAACATGGHPAPALPPLGADGEVHVFLSPFPREADRLSFTVAQASLRQRDGGDVPLQLALREVAEGGQRNQRLLAWGRVPPGDYTGIVLKFASAGIAHDGQRSRLLVPPDPTLVELGFRADGGRAIVTWLELKPAESIRANYDFTPAFRATIGPQTPPLVAIYSTDSGAASVTAVDRQLREVTGIIPVGASPHGIVLDPATARAYVTLYREDQLEMLDVAAYATTGRIRLRPGDGPDLLELAPDGTLVVLNERSRTVSFVDPRSMTELSRVDVGDSPAALLVDRSGHRAYVANRGSASVTILDLGNRAVAGTIATDAEPILLALSRDGSRLFVVYRGSGQIGVFTIPSLAPEPRRYVALGITAMRLDPRTDLLYLSRGDDRRISVYDSLSVQEVDRFDVPGAVSYMAIDDTEDTLLAVMPERRSYAVIDLTSRKLLAEVPLGAEPYRLAFARERR